MNKKRPSLAFLDIFWVLIPKIIVILAENQYLGRFAGYQGSMICSYTLFSSHYGLSTKRPRYWFSVKTTMIFGISTQKISKNATPILDPHTGPHTLCSRNSSIIFKDYCSNDRGVPGHSDKITCVLWESKGVYMIFGVSGSIRPWKAIPSQEGPLWVQKTKVVPEQ